MKIFDLNLPPIFGNDLQKNIITMKNTYGSKFIIKDGDNELPSLLYIVKQAHNPKLQYYSLVYDIPERDAWLLPYKISFIDIIKMIGGTSDYSSVKNNNCYLANIHRTDKINGTNLVNIILKLLKLLGAEQVILNDGAHISCGDSEKEIDLSFFKLIEKGITFYQKFGFEFLMDPGNPWPAIDFGSTNNMKKTIHKSLANINKIKLNYYKDAYIKILDIIQLVIKNQDYENVKIYLYHPFRPFLIKKENVKEKLLSMIKDIDTLLNIIKLSERKYLKDTLIDTFYADCNTYMQLEDLIFSNLFMGISYKKKKIYLKHNDIFYTLKFIRNSAIFELKLN